MPLERAEENTRPSTRCVNADCSVGWGHSPSSLRLESELAVDNNHHHERLELDPNSNKPSIRGFLCILETKCRLPRRLAEHEDDEWPTISSCTGTPKRETHLHKLVADVGAEHQWAMEDLGRTYSDASTPPPSSCCRRPRT
nr:unnamed protein product [Digitaria exilis]